MRGVAFKVAQALLADLPGGPAAALALTDLATIGTVADVAPIVGENRAIARLGLERLRAAPRPGIAALLSRARIEPAAADLETIAFALAPRLNAAGRMGEAMVAARLLLAESSDEAAPACRRPRGGQPRTPGPGQGGSTEARAMVDETAAPAATLIHGPWSVGIVGLVAARLAEDHGRPAVVGADIGDTIRASCRSDGSLDLGAALERCGDLFTRFGGHAGAAGFEIAGRPLAGVPRALPGRRGRVGAARPADARCGSTSPCRHSASTTRCSGSWPVWRPAGPGTRSHSSRCSA